MSGLTELFQGIEQGQIGDLRGPILNTLSACHLHVPLGFTPGQKGFNQCGFANANITTDQHQPASPSGRFAQSALELFKLRTATGHSSFGERITAGPNSLYPLDHSAEAIPLIPHGFNVLRGASLLTQRVTDLTDAHPEYGARYGRPAPQLPEQLLFGNHLFGTQC